MTAIINQDKIITGGGIVLKKTVAVLLAAIMSASVFGSCSKDGRVTSTTAEPVSDTASETFVMPSEWSTVPETTAPQSSEPSTVSSDGRLTVGSEYRTVAMTREDVIKVYTAAMNNVKLRCPGFTKKEVQTVDNVKAGDGALQLANRILNLVSNELITSSGSDSDTVTVKAGDDRAVRRSFPLFGKDVGCELTDTSIVTSAVCYVSDTDYKVVLTVADHADPDPETSEFSKILTPIPTKSISDGIEEYLVVLDMSSYKFEMNYTNNEIECHFDKTNGRMISLAQKMIVNVDIDMNLDLIFFKTKNISASGTVINKVEYNDFVWVQ